MAPSRLIRFAACVAVCAGPSVFTTDVAGRASDPLQPRRPVASGAAHSLAIDPSGQVWSWGQNLVGQLGTGDRRSRQTPTRVPGLAGVFVAVSAGTGHSLALRTDGALFAWGLNLEGQLGIGSNAIKLAPVHVPTLSNVIAIAAGGGHSLALKADGSVWAWGGNLVGQVGDGGAGQRRRPVRIATLTNVTAVEAGLTHSLALRSDGSIWSWGANGSGQLGIGSSAPRRRPVRVPHVPSARGIAAGALHNLALTASGTVWGWGKNAAGAVGDGSTATRRTPVALSGIPPIAAVAAGTAHSVAITSSGSALAWGDNTAGQLGDGTTTRRLRPVAVMQPPSRITAIAAGGAHTLALAGDGVYWTWGHNLLAQLGDGTHHRRTAPSPISGPGAAWGVHPPLFSPPGGTFNAGVSVSLSTPTPGAIVRYTLDGTDPTGSSAAAVAPIHLAVTTTVKAMAFRTGLAPSHVAVATYTIGGGALAVPAATPGGGTYAQAQTVTLSAEAGADVRYSLDGSEPALTSPVATGAITIASTTTLRARAFRAGFAPSAILTEHYVILTSPPPGEDPPPDPATVAPPLSDVELTDFADAQAFLFEGADPIQRNHTPGSIAAARLCVIRGRVLTRDGTPLAGVRVTPIDQPGAGHTVTRDDGMFDLAVNGGGPVTLDYTRDGFLPAQRAVDAPWKDFAAAPDLRLVPLDPVVTPVSFEPQAVAVAARGSVSSDDSGTRQATIIVPETGVMAIVHLPDGTTMPGVSRLSIRATEYTVGAGGPDTMPATLPATSGYTYAVELTADEAIHAGATGVTFDPPLAFYVENFLQFPVGSAAPVGFYDRARAEWVPSDDGRVIGVLGANEAGEAELDIDGSGQAADADMLSALGITSGERTRLAALYAPGQSLWRAAIPHFSPWDMNWPVGPPQDAEPPELEVNNPGPRSPGTRSTQRTGLMPGADGQADRPCREPGSIVECQNQTLGEWLAIAGTPFALAYRSDRMPGYTRPRTMSIPLTNARVSDSLKRVELDVRVAGQSHRFSFAPTPGQSTSFTWNGADVFGRPLAGLQLAKATVGHVYDAVYYDSPVSFQRSFARPPSPGAVVARSGRNEVSLQQPMEFWVESPHASQAPVGGWSISAHHRYDARSGVLFMGDGARRSAAAVGDVIDTAAGGGDTPVDGTPVSARDARLTDFVRAVAAAGDGVVYLADSTGVLLLASGLLSRIVTFDAGAGNDFQPGLAAWGGTAVYADGDIEGDCIEGGSYAKLRVRRLTPGGLGEELAVFEPDPFLPPSCQGGTKVAVGTDGSFFVAAGPDVWLIRQGGAPALVGRFSPVTSLAAGPGGSVYIGAALQVHHWRPDGSVRIVAGNGTNGNGGDGGPARFASLGLVTAMAVDADGNLLIASAPDVATRIRVVRTDGTIESYAGSDDGLGSIANGAPGRGVPLGMVRGLALAPDGSLFVADGSSAAPLLLRLRLAFDATRVPSEDGSAVYEFDVSGRHLRTVDALTGVALHTFAYDAAGRLLGIADRDGLYTRIVRGESGAAQSIVSPFGVITTLTIGAGGFLESVTDPEGRTTAFGYREGGLLTSLRDANGGLYTFDYDAEGLLRFDEDPAGGTQALSRADAANGWAVTRHVSDAGATTYLTHQGANGTQTQRVVAPDGSEAVSLNRGDGSTVTTSPDGTETTVSVSPDPRFGLGAPVVAATTIRSPAGLTMTVTKSRAVTLSNPDDPLSVVTHTETTAINGRVSSRAYDAGARTITTTSAANRQVVTTLDELGRPASVQVGAAMVPTTFTYDAAGRLTSQAQGPRITTFAYDDGGFLSRVTDPLSRTLRFTNDAAGRRLSHTFPDDREATFGYDGNGNLTSLTPPGRPAHSMTYTPANQLESYSPPSVGQPALTRYQFNLARQPLAVTRADGQQISWTYDAAGRPETMTTPTGATTYAYHPATGQLVSLASPSGGLAYSYDGALQTAEAASGFTTGVVSWTYDHSFRRTTERVNDANPIAFTYDADSLLTSAGALTYTRRATDGVLLTAALGGALTTFTYSNFGELTSEETRRSASVLHRAVYTRDAGGRVVERTETMGGTITTEAYVYDAAGRLTGVIRNGGPHASYAYDANGNRTRVTSAAGTIDAAYDAQDRLLTFGDRAYTHTPHGEVRSWTDSGGTTTLSYDVQGNLLTVALPTGTTVEYVVDARNRRIGRKVNGVVTHRWLYQGELRPAAELDAAGAVITRFVYGARAVAPEYMIRGGVTYRLVADHLGSVRLVVDPATGAIVQRIDYDAWGRVVSDSNPGLQPFGFAGGLYDADTGLARFGVRDYDATTGRWLSRDPITVGSGDANLYRYGYADPINRVDPDGLMPLAVAIVAVGAVVGGVSEGLNAWAAGGGAGQIAAAALQGSVAGALGSITGIGVGLVTGNPALIGASAGFVNELVLQMQRGCTDATALAVSTVMGGGAAKYVSAIPELTLRGRAPDLFSSRAFADFGANAMRLLKGEGLGSTLAEFGKSISLNVTRGQ